MLRAVTTLIWVTLLGVLVSSCTLVEGNGRHLVPLSYAAKSKLSMMQSSPEAAMMIRIFKQEGVLEVWKQTASGPYRLFQSYDICAWSGELGPKRAEGDRQAPEGFYTITPRLMNPRSSYHLAFNLGFPNAFDRAHGRTGSNLMVHGACSSAGCYAMEDDQIAEIYALARESFAGGNRSFEVQVFPFRMTPQNLATHRDNENFDFWMNLKEGADYFEVAQTPPAWDVCEQRYVFREPTAAQAAADLAGACPPVRANPQIVSAFTQKQASDRDAMARALDSLAADEAAQLDAEKRQARRDAALQERGEAINNAVSGLIGGVLGG